MARYITIDCTKIQDQEHLHQVFSEALHFPGWYGRNLDALYDCLTDLEQETKIMLFCWSVLEDRLGAYAEKTKFVLTQAMDDNIDLTVRFSDDLSGMISSK